MIALYPYLKWIHILSAIVAIGSNATYAIWLNLAKKEPAATRFIMRGIEAVEKLANTGYALLVITGLTMTFVGGIPLTTPWILSALILIVVIGVLAVLFYTPALKKQIAFAEKPESPEYKAADQRAMNVGVLVLLLVILIEFLMTVKPALWG